jgi:hypothetical protein
MVACSWVCENTLTLTVVRRLCEAGALPLGDKLYNTTKCALDLSKQCNGICCSPLKSEW